MAATREWGRFWPRWDLQPPPSRPSDPRTEGLQWPGIVTDTAMTTITASAGAVTSVMIVAAEAASVAMTKTTSMVRDVSAVAGPVRIVTTGAMAIRTAGGWADRIRFSPVKAAIS